MITADLLAQTPELFQRLYESQQRLREIHTLLTERWPQECDELARRGFIAPNTETLLMVARRISATSGTALASVDLRAVTVNARVNALVVLNDLKSTVEDQIDLAPLSGFLDWQRRAWRLGDWLRGVFNDIARKGDAQFDDAIRKAIVGAIELGVTDS